MILEVIPAEYFGTNCWIFAPAKNSECFIVDPGICVPNMVGHISDVLEKHNLKPIATIVTHGHLDHTFSVQPFDDKYQVATYVHTKDRAFLADPFKLLAADGGIRTLLDELGVKEFKEPHEVKELKHGEEFSLIGMKIKAHHAPGHTPGSTMFSVDDEYLISGDVLFANSIGRTDLLLGSAEDMKKSLQNVVLPLGDHLKVLPGHGRETTIGHERKNNPYLQDFFLKGKRE